MKYKYPAIFEKTDCGYNINFPDLRLIIPTNSKTISECFNKAEKSLKENLKLMKMMKKEIPMPTDSRKFELNEGDDVVAEIEVELEGE